MQNKLNHLAIVMDGNGRWAAQQEKNSAAGHKAGAENIFDIVREVSAHDIKHLTLYAFSTENWQRPPHEVSYLMELMSHYVHREIDRLHEHGIRLHVVGDLSRLQPSLRSKIDDAINQTSENSTLNLYIAFSYGGRQEIVEACRKIINTDINSDEVTPEIFAQHLYNVNMPDVDLFIRTSGEHRISNFLLWQIAYAELYFTDVLWPDFDQKELEAAINEFNNRKRRFGKRV